MPGCLSHVGLFYSIHQPIGHVETVIRDFWERLGYTVNKIQVPVPLRGRSQIDRGGAGARFWIFSGQHLLFSYVPNPHDGEALVKVYSQFALGLHVALQATPAEYERLRADPAFERETDGWHNGAHSVFLHGPWGLEVEFVINGFFPSDETEDTSDYTRG